MRAYLDLLLLAVVHGDPGDGAAVMRELRHRSGGRITAGAGRSSRRCTASSATGSSTAGALPRRYLLTEAGRRSLAARQRA